MRQAFYVAPYVQGDFLNFLNLAYPFLKLAHFCDGTFDKRRALAAVAVESKIVFVVVFLFTDDRRT